MMSLTDPKCNNIKLTLCLVYQMVKQRLSLHKFLLTPGRLVLPNIFIRKRLGQDGFQEYVHLSAKWFNLVFPKLLQGPVDTIIPPATGQELPFLERLNEQCRRMVRQHSGVIDMRLWRIWKTGLDRTNVNAKEELGCRVESKAGHKILY